VVLLFICEPGTKIAGTKMRPFQKTMMAHLEMELKHKENHLGLRDTAPQFNPFGGVRENPYVSWKVSLLQTAGHRLAGV
jgi:hypothetical protein